MIAALNTVHGAVTEYDHTFVSFASIGSRHFGAGPDGIFELVGADDDGTPIAADVRTGKLDFNDSHTKRATDAYVEASCDGQLVFHVHTPTADYAYPLGDPSDELVNRKANLGRGVKTRRWQFGLTNEAGADFEVAEISVLVDATSRRV